MNVSLARASIRLLPVLFLTLLGALCAPLTPTYASGTPPSITPIANQLINMGTSTAALLFTVNDAVTPAVSLTVTCAASNTALVPTTGIALIAPNTQGICSVSLTPKSVYSGVSTITLTVKDGSGLTAKTSFILTVNHPPTITKITNQSIYESTATSALALTVGDDLTPGASLSVTGASSNITLAPVANIVFAGTGATRSVTVTPVAGKSGIATISLIVTDSGGLTTTTSFILTVKVPPSPTITAIANQLINMGTSTSALAFTVGDAITPAASLTITSASSNTALIPTTGIVLVGPSAAGVCSVTITPKSVYSGVTTMTLTVFDGNGRTAKTTFTLTVNHPPTITTIAKQTVNLNTASAALAFSIGDDLTPVNSLSVTGVSSNSTLFPTIRMVFGGSGAARTVIVMPGNGQTGTATITLTVKDSGDMTVCSSFVVTVNAPPTMTTISNQTISMAFSTAALTFSVADDLTTATALIISATSSNTALVKAAGMVLSGPDTQGKFSVTVTPVAAYSGVTTITLTVKDGGGLSTAMSFMLTVSKTLSITSFTPTSGPIGQSVTLTGMNFTGATAVSFNGMAATFTVVNSTTITTIVPIGATIGTISVTTPGGGTATSTPVFTETMPGSLVGRWDAVTTQGLGSSDVGMFITASSASGFSGTLLGYPLTVVMTGQSGTGSCPELSSFSSFAVFFVGAQIFLEGTTYYGDLTFTFNQLSSNPVTPYTGSPIVVSSKIFWNSKLREYVMSVTWDRPTGMGWDFSICQGGHEYVGYLYVDHPNLSYDSVTFTRNFPLTNMPLILGSCTLNLEESGCSGDTCDWQDPYGANAWTTPAGVYSNVLTVLVASPMFNPPANQYALAQSITIQSSTNGAIIRYTTDGSTPSETNGTVYTKPVLINDGTNLQAIAYLTGNNSVVTSGVYTINGITVISKINSTDGAPMVWVPGGSFTMGCPAAIDGGEASGGESQQVTLSGYWIYENEVTVAQYRAFCDATGHALPPYPGPWLSWVGTDWTDPSVQQMPIVDVDWYDCNAYADWAGVQLPTEAQYEYASRGPSGNNYSWGGMATAVDTCNGWDATKCANHDNSYVVGKSTWPVGSFPAGASWCGAQDISGNVWEWCADWYGDYATKPVTDPMGPTTGDHRVQRGASWDDYNYGVGDNGDFYNRGVYRYEYNLPDRYDSCTGFRCASVSTVP